MISGFNHLRIVGYPELNTPLSKEISDKLDAAAANLKPIVLEIYIAHEDVTYTITSLLTFSKFVENGVIGTIVSSVFEFIDGEPHQFSYLAGKWRIVKVV